MSWTTSYPLSIRRNPTGIQMTWPVAVKMADEFWIFCKTDYVDTAGMETVDELIIFQTETCTMEKIEIKDETEGLIGFTQFTAKNDEQIYLWMDCDEGWVLCKFDIKTRIISHVLTLPAKRLYEYTPIIGDTMHALFRDENERELTLKTINLSTKEVIRDSYLKRTANEDYEHGLLVNDGKLYVLEFDKEIGIKIYKSENELIFLSEQKLHEKVEDINEIYACEDGVHYGVKQNDTPTYYRYTFDFEILNWKKTLVRPVPDEFWRYLSKDTEDFDGITYATIMPSNSRISQFCVRVFENQPKLSSVCYLNIVKELMKTGDLTELDRIKQLLPVEMGMKLDNMMKWRIEEKENEYRQKLITQQRKKVMDKLIELMGDGTIDEELFVEFEKFFSFDNHFENEDDDDSDEDDQVEEEEELNMNVDY